MPELPDLEVYKDNIFKRLTSTRLVNLKVFSMKITTPESILIDELSGRELLCINRHGKELFFDFGENRIISAHLMLSGRISVSSNADSIDKIKSKVLSLEFENESIVFYDAGNVGAVIKYKPVPSNVPDAFSSDFTYDYFAEIARKKSAVNVKAFLIDQKVVRGIGNAYADEILWMARISPKSTIGKIPSETLYELYKAIGATLRDAVVSIKAIAPDIISGEERSFLKVHTKAKKITDTGFSIIVEKIASKTTYYTQEQILYT